MWIAIAAILFLRWWLTSRRLLAAAMRADGCAVLDDDEPESLLCHKCAHVARRDNLIGVFEAVVCSVFWFNPRLEGNQMHVFAVKNERPVTRQ